MSRKEKWIAISADVYNLLDIEGQGSLYSACRRESLSLLRVPPTVHYAIFRNVTASKGIEGLHRFLACYHGRMMYGETYVPESTRTCSGKHRCASSSIRSSRPCRFSFSHGLQVIY